MKQKKIGHFSGFFIIVILLWTLTRLMLCASSIFVIMNIENFGHLTSLIFLYPSAWFDLVFGLLSLVFGYLFLFKSKPSIICLNTSVIIASISQAYLAYSHYYVHFELGADNLSQGIGKTLMIVLHLYFLFLINRNRSLKVKTKSN